MDEFWTANTEMVAAEDFDGETVIINFETGRYFSLGGAATWIWDQLASGARVADLAARAPADATREIVDAIGTLAAEGLVVAAPHASGPVAEAPAPWSTPSIEIFSDLAELVALDPVHEVNAMMGWPHRAAP